MDRAQAQQQLHDDSKDEIDTLIWELPWDPLPDRLVVAIAVLPSTAETCFRMDILSWIYLQQGYMTFEELACRFTGFEHTSEAKRSLRNCLRSMRKTMLVSIHNFAIKEGGAPAPDREIGKGSLISLSWFGMKWLERGWQARLCVLRRSPDPEEILQSHLQMCDEEDEGKANDPYWIDDRGIAVSHRAAKVGKNLPAAPTSVWDLGKEIRVSLNPTPPRALSQEAQY